MKPQTKKLLIVGAIALVLLLATPGSADAEELIKGFEVGQGNDPYLRAIPDAKGRWQIGFGSTWNYTKNRWVQPGDIISVDEAYQFMRNEIAEKSRTIDSVVRVPINANQKKALVSLAYNIGTTAFSGSTLLSLLNAGRDKLTVANQFDVWRIADGKVSPGLVARRAKEKAIFLS